MRSPARPAPHATRHRAPGVRSALISMPPSGHCLVAATRRGASPRDGIVTDRSSEFEIVGSTASSIAAHVNDSVVRGYSATVSTGASTRACLDPSVLMSASAWPPASQVPVHSRCEQRDTVRWQEGAGYGIGWSHGRHDRSAPCRGGRRRGA
jgi:hypothetical protein